MKHSTKTFIFLLLSGIVFFFPKTAYAAKCGSVDTVLIECSEDEGLIINDILSGIIGFLSIGIGIAGVIGLAIVGVQYLISKSDEQQANKAKNRLKNVIIGLALYSVTFAILSWLLPGFPTEVRFPEKPISVSNNSQSNNSYKNLLFQQILSLKNK